MSLNKKECYLLVCPYCSQISYCSKKTIVKCICM